jgi:hypothetical protein
MACYNVIMITLGNAKLSVGPGWGKILTWLYLFKPCHVQVTQVKEKYGGLRFYVGSAPIWYHEMIHRAENRSERTCEVCGKPGKIYTKGWYICRCPKHATN